MFERAFLLIITFALPLLAQDNDAFLTAVRARDVEVVQSMLAANPSLAMAKSKSGSSAVVAAMFAIKKGEEGFPDPKSNAVLRAILTQKPDLDFFETAALGTPKQLMDKKENSARDYNGFGWTALHFAAFAGNAETAKLLIARGAEVNARAKTKFRNTPLQAALLSGQYETAKVLLESGADPLVRQAKGFTPMHEAALLGRADLVQLLLDHGAEINSRSDDGKTPLSEALRGHHEAMAATLKAKGAVAGDIFPSSGE